MDDQTQTHHPLSLLTIDDVATLLKVSKRTIHRLIRRKELPALKLGGQWRVSESRLIDWLESRQQQESAKKPKLDSLSLNGTHPRA